MIALVTSFVLPALFVGSGLFAVAVLARMWRRYAGIYRSLRAELALYEAIEPTLIRCVVRETAEPSGPARRAVRTSLRRPAARPVSPARRAAA